MSTKVPIYRQYSFPGIAFVIVVIALAAYIGWQVWQLYGMVIAVAIIAVYALASRRIIASGNVRGLALLKEGKFREAISAYDECMERFERHPWLDQYRFVIMLSTSGMCNREAAMVSKAYCHVQLNEAAIARKLYQQCADEYPNNILAPSTLRFMDAMKDEKK